VFDGRRAVARRAREDAGREAAALTTTLLHITAEAAWSAARDQGSTLPEAFAAEGFVHCSEPDQVVRVANARFVGRTDLVLLWISGARLSAPVRYENLEGGDELFSARLRSHQSRRRRRGHAVPA
jgi:uncharacterized protein (DUF952 family)